MIDMSLDMPTFMVIVLFKHHLCNGRHQEGVTFNLLHYCRFQWSVIDVKFYSYKISRLKNAAYDVEGVRCIREVFGDWCIIKMYPGRQMILVQSTVNKDSTP